MEASPELRMQTQSERSTSALEEEFRFSLEGHKLIDPETNRGSVVGIKEVAPLSEYGEELPCQVYEIDIEDPFVSTDPEGFKLVNDYIETIESRMRLDEFNPLDSRSEALSRTEQNKYTKAWLSDEKVKSLKIWRDLVPTAEALSYLTNPWVDTIVTNREGEAARMSEETAAHFRFVDDAIGIRDRGIAMEALATEHLLDFKRGSHVRWLSLASGTAEPSIAAAKHAMDEDGFTIDLSVADLDGRALKHVQENAARLGFDSQVKTIKANILGDDLGDKLEEITGYRGQYDVVENMGFEEYLPQDGDEVGAFKGAELPQASDFTRKAFNMVKPGGILLSGNMVLGRTQLGFVFGGVDWPLINARSEESILRVYKEAGILDDPKAKLEMYRVKDSHAGTHIYNIVKVTKLA